MAASQENLDSFPYSAFLFQSIFIFLFFIFYVEKRARLHLADSI